MNIFSVRSKSNKIIRLTDTIWNKISKEHLEFEDKYLEEMKETIRNPDYIVEGWQKELLALKWCDIAPAKPKYLCVVYRELNGEGFIITAFFISRYGKLLRRNILWQKN